MVLVAVSTMPTSFSLNPGRQDQHAVLPTRRVADAGGAASDPQHLRSRVCLTARQ